MFLGHIKMYYKACSVTKTNSESSQTSSCLNLSQIQLYVHDYFTIEEELHDIHEQEFHLKCTKIQKNYKKFCNTEPNSDVEPR